MQINETTFVQHCANCLAPIEGGGLENDPQRYPGPNPETCECYNI